MAAKRYSEISVSISDKKKKHFKMICFQNVEINQIYLIEDVRSAKSQEPKTRNGDDTFWLKSPVSPPFT